HIWSYCKWVCGRRQDIAHIAIHAFHALAINLGKAGRCGTYTKACVYSTQPHVRPRVPELFSRTVIHGTHSISPFRVSLHFHSSVLYIGDIIQHAGYLADVKSTILGPDNGKDRWQDRYHSYPEHTQLLKWQRILLLRNSALIGAVCVLRTRRGAVALLRLQDPGLVD